MKTFILLVSTLTAFVIQGLIVSDTSPTNITSILNHVANLEQTVNGLHDNQTVNSLYLTSLSGEIVAMKFEMRKREEEFASVKTQFAKLQTENDRLRALNLTVLDKMGSDVKTCLSEIQRQENSTSFALQGIKDVLKSVTESLSNASSSSFPGFSKTSPVYYEVQYHTDDHTILQTNSVIILDTVVVNIGNGYNILTGVFTAPISGYYLLWGTFLGIYPEDNNEDYTHLNVDLIKRSPNNTREIISSAFATILDPYGSATLTTIYHLTSGDMLWYNSTRNIILYGNRYTGHGGMLLDSESDRRH